MYASTLTNNPTFISTTATPFVNFSHSSRHIYRNLFIKQHYPTLTPTQTQQLFSLYFLDDVDISVSWEVEGTHRRGHHYIMGVNTSLQSPLQMQNRYGRLALEQSGLKNANKGYPIKNNIHI